jgi:hypothetical protein
MTLWGLRQSFPIGFALCLALGGFASAQTIDLPVPVGMDGDPAARSVTDGNAAFLNGDLRSAASLYRAALRRKHDFAIATFNLGLVEMHTGDAKRGLRDMDRGIALARRHGMSEPDIARLRSLRAGFENRVEST